MTVLVLPLLGALVLGGLFFDVLVTVFHPQGRGGPINRTQNRMVWKLFRALGKRRKGAARSHLLAFCGPVLAVLTIVTWAVLLILGFALIFYPFASSFRVDPGTVEADWVRALYFSGYVASTLGVGDVTPATPALRLLTVVEAFAGFVLFAVAVTYALAVYRELGVSAALALDISGYFQGGVRKVFEAAHKRGFSVVESWIDQTTRMLLRVTQAHSQYPIMHFFHSPDPQQSLDLQLGELIALLRHAESEDGYSFEVGDRSPSLMALRRALETHMREVNHHVIPARFEPIPGELEDAPLQRQYRRMLRYMLYPASEEVLGPDEALGPQTE